MVNKLSLSPVISYVLVVFNFLYTLEIVLVPDISFVSKHKIILNHSYKKNMSPAVVKREQTRKKDPIITNIDKAFLTKARIILIMSNMVIIAHNALAFYTADVSRVHVM